MENNIVRCNNCYWKGYEDELEVIPISVDNGNDVTFMKGCPKCKTDDYLTDLWVDDSEG
jgi:hypothetical protein